MIVVSNTSPLNYAILIQAIDVFPGLFGRVIVPESVAEELSHPGAPETVRAWISGPPSWLEIASPNTTVPDIDLHPGERDALCIALERGADLVLVDDQAARRVAREHGIPVTGTLGVLERAAERGLLNLEQAIDALRRTSYRIREEVLESLLKRHAQRRFDPDERD